MKRLLILLILSLPCHAQMLQAVVGQSSNAVLPAPVIQHYIRCNSNASHNCATNWTTTLHNSLFVHTYANDLVTNSITDIHSTGIAFASWHVVQLSPASNAGSGKDVWYFTSDIISEVNTTITAVETPTQQSMGFEIYEVSGAANWSSALSDVIDVHHEFGSGAVATTDLSTADLVTTVTNDLLLMGCEDFNGATYSAGTGWTMEATQDTAFTAGTERQTATAPGTYTAHMTNSASNTRWTCASIAIKP